MIDFTILVISYNCVSECVPLLSYCYIWRSWVCASKTYFQMQPTRCNVTQFIYFCETLYMFQAVPLPIIRSSNCTYNFRYFVKPLLLPGTVVAGSSKGLTKYPMLYVQFELLMMGRGTAWNMYSVSQKQINCVTLHLVGCIWKYIIVILSVSAPLCECKFIQTVFLSSSTLIFDDIGTYLYFVCGWGGVYIWAYVIT